MCFTRASLGSFAICKCTQQLYRPIHAGPEAESDSVSIAWFILAIPILSFPTILPVTEVNMNCESTICYVLCSFLYHEQDARQQACNDGTDNIDAAVVFVGFALISVVWYLVYGRKHYSGPPDGHTSL